MHNMLVLYDRETGLLWSQALIPASLAHHLGDWKTRCQHTPALRKGYAGDIDPYSDFYLSNNAGVLCEAVRDRRLLEQIKSTLSFCFVLKDFNPQSRVYGIDR
ncbi:MAG: hypothetical protein A2W36_02210 [Chloroflexi bacterium RBG_16_58_14]|nr:MAG: hypothetical protein A2W36_02210 [Chloroflexi bacterium RBG_16_58_14]